MARCAQDGCKFIMIYIFTYQSNVLVMMQEDELAKLRAELADMEAEDEALKLKKMQVCVCFSDEWIFEDEKICEVLTLFAHICRKMHRKRQEWRHRVRLLRTLRRKKKWTVDQFM